MRVLVVKNPFGGRDAGHRITDESEIDEILDGEHASDVIEADHPDETSEEE